MWFGHMGNFGFGGMLLGGLIMLIFWGSMIAVTVIAVRAVWNSGSGRSGSPSPSDDAAIEIAKQRYASGDISREEYLEIKKDLGG